MNFTLTFSVAEAQIVMDALGDRPYSEVAALYQRLAMQLQTQQQMEQKRLNPVKGDGNVTPISGEVGGDIS